VAISTQECFIGLAIVDLGWTTTAFAYVFDCQHQRLLADVSQDGLPRLSATVNDSPLGVGKTWFKHLGTVIRCVSQDADHYRLTVKTRTGLRIDAEIDATNAAPSLTAIGPVIDGGCAHATVKTSALAVTGVASVGGKTFQLDGGIASMDYSNGLLARDTAWRWASAHSATVGFNLQQGYFGGHENALWLDGELIPLGAAQFAFNPADPMQPWRLTTDDGLLGLDFQPMGLRQETKKMLIAASDYVQPIGHFDGWVKAKKGDWPRLVEGLMGVTEDHRARW
jgi:hypothetical protein